MQKLAQYQTSSSKFYTKERARSITQLKEGVNQILRLANLTVHEQWLNALFQHITIHTKGICHKAQRSLKNKSRR